jgi:ubiquinone/menaquinone biosynthesis C-methylase UbiE
VKDGETGSGAVAGDQVAGYSEEETGRLELIWGDGFLSPGGPAEVTRVLSGHDIAGCAVLDIGSGAGGVDIALVRDHGAATVIGVDVQQELVELATERAMAAGVGDRISYRVIDSGPLPFDDATFDVVFSKDAIIHVNEKEALYGEAFRVLRPAGRLLVSDWLRGHADELTAQVDAFVEAAGHGFVMASLHDVEAMLERVGFTRIESQDRRSWYLAEAAAELEGLRGEMRREFVARWGEDAAHAEIEFWEVLLASLSSGALSPAHVRARKPKA